MNTKEQIIDFVIGKLKGLGFVNVNKTNLLKDDVYQDHFRKVIDSIKEKNDCSAQLINDLLKSILRTNE